MNLFKEEPNECLEYIKKQLQIDVEAESKRVYEKFLNDSGVILFKLDEEGFINVKDLTGEQYQKLEGTIYDTLVKLHFEEKEVK